MYIKMLYAKTIKNTSYNGSKKGEIIKKKYSCTKLPINFTVYVD